jgi:beta-galactosidase
MNLPIRARFLKLACLAVAAAGVAFTAPAQNTTPVATATPASPAASSSAAIPLTTIVPDGKPHKFEARDHQFFIDGQPTVLISGEMHFGRVQAEDWETRIKQAKAMGLNAISFYLFWNQVEPQEGRFDFTGMNDVRRVLKLCQDNGIWAILRPGPYCCAEVEYGGIPYWTLKYPNVKIRVNDPKFLDWCQKYIAQVYQQVADLQVTKGGPLLMVQIDNEYGITDPANNDYMNALHKIFLDTGFDVQLFTCDPTHAPEWKDPSFRMPGVMICRNGLKDDAGFRLSADAIGNYPVYVPEVYTAWFSGWAEPIATRNSSIPAITTWINYLLDHQYSFNLYLFFGGTNYGFYNGCNFFLPVQTSYDYSAPIDEAGRTTPKYYAIRALLTQRLNLKLPDPPADPAVIEIPTIKFTDSEPLLSTLPAQPTLVADQPVSMENLGQDYGFVLYRKQFPNGLNGTLVLNDARDYTFVMVNGKTVARAFRGYGPDSNTVAINQSGNVTLDLLVYNLGRISVVTSDRTQDLARKGLIGSATLNGQALTGWTMYSLPYASGVDNFTASTAPHSGPAFYHATFTLDQLGGTFLDLSNWHIGVVWVNGHNLGRFWDRGGLRSLFLPREWLKQGSNDILVLELLGAPKTPEITGVKNIVSAPNEPFAVKLDAPPTF